MEGYRDALFAEVIPAIERDYHADARRERRAIAGLSMGGAESLFVGLNAIDRFAWIGAFSSGGLGDAATLPKTFPSLTAAEGKRLQLLWIACGTEDRLIEANRQMRAFLTERGVVHEAVETPGAHTWTGVAPQSRRFHAEAVPLGRWQVGQRDASEARRPRWWYCRNKV